MRTKEEIREEEEKVIRQFGYHPYYMTIGAGGIAGGYCSFAGCQANLIGYASRY